MKKIQAVLFALLVMAMMPLSAQIVTTSPSLLQEGSRDVVLTYDAASPLGNKGLEGLGSNFDVYAHIGVLTTKSENTGDWRYVVAPWPSTGNQSLANTDKNRLSRVADNTYELRIGNIRDYFGIKDADEHVKTIVLVFRNADGSREGKTASGGDIMVDVKADGFAIELVSDHSDRVISGPATITYTLRATEAADLSLCVDGVAFASKSAATELVAAYDFKSHGTFAVEGKAVYGGKDYTAKAEVSYPAPSSAKDYPGGTPKMGAVRNADGSVTFCLAAPGKSSVQMVPSWDNYQILDKNLMNYQDYQGNRYFWTTVSGLADDVWYSYYYIVDDTYKVADPYAHLVLDCYSDEYLRPSVWRDAPRHPGAPYQDIMMAVYRGDIDDYEFSPFTIPDHDNLVVYELLFRDFTGVNGQNNGWGTVRKAIDKIPYIKELGFNAVELMPVMEFNGNNSWGYNTNFYMAPDKAYGSPTDYKDFIEECHRNGIAVILDIVFNQSDGLHPWYQMYPPETNPFYNKVAPHAWSVLNDWNQDNPLVQQQWTDALKYWLEKYNVDGFRFDLVKGLGDNASYDGIGTDAYNQSRVDRMKRLHAVIKSVKPDGIHINELLGSAAEEKALGEDGQIQWANINDASCQYAMGWDTGNNNLMRFLSTSDGDRPWGSTISYAESHDEQRMAFKSESFGKDPVPDDAVVRYDRLAALAVQMLLTPGPKMVWMFGELGDSQNAKKNADGGGDNNTDPKYVDWRWLDDPDKNALRETYKWLVNARMNNPELFARTAAFTSNRLGLNFSKGRSMRLTADDKELVAFINPAVDGQPVDVTVNSTILTGANARCVWLSRGFNPELKADGTKLTVSVPANGFAIYSTSNFSSAGSVVADDAAVTAVAEGGRGEIVIRGEYSSVAVYNMAGAAMGSLTVPAGIYIVVIDGRATKVAVR